MTTGGYGQMRATDADRERVHALLQAAYADGRLTWEEFDARSTALLSTRTYGQLTPLTADLRGPEPYRPAGSPPVPAMGSRTNPLAVASLGLGIGQVLAWGVGGIAAIITGHVARSQIRRTGEGGRALATAGLVLGYAGTLFWGLIVVLIAIAATR